jgi:MscS family membrane protein
MSARLGIWLSVLVLLLLPFQAVAQSAAEPTDALNAYPLRPPNLASPGDTLRSFQENMQEAIRRHQARASPAATDRAAVRAIRCLDLSKLPPAERIDQGFELAVMLLEILERIELPPLEQIPDVVAAEANELKTWTIPNTEITIARTQEGPQAGEFQFTAPTVKRLPAFYELVKNLPYKPGAVAGFYEQWSYSPGPWLPQEWTTTLPKFAYVVVFKQTIWQWLGALATFALTAAVIVLAYNVARRLDRAGSDTDRPGYLARLTITILAIALIELAAAFLDDAINITGKRLFVLGIAWHAAQAAAVGWFILLSLNAIGEAIIRVRDSRPGSVDAHLVRIIFRILAIVAVIYLAIVVADSFGVPAAPLIASLGVGGLAIALAVRPTLENVVGGFILFADKPVRVGDFCRYGDEIGTVEQIGLRSTRVRSLERTIVTVPNAEFSQMKLDNFSARDQRLLKTVLQLRYETTPEQMRYVLVKLRELLLGHPMVTPEPARARFLDFGAYSKDVEIFAYLRCQDQDTFLAIKEDILLRIEDIIVEAGTGFAFPSQTAYLARDHGIDGERASAAKTEVEQWRVKGKLPFPEFEDEEREGLEDILDYPPKGSPQYQPRTGLSQAPPASPTPTEDVPPGKLERDGSK